jgi:hypothetical protein
MVNNMMQLLQQNMSKQTVELHAAAVEKEQYKAKCKTFFSTVNTVTWFILGNCKTMAEILI